MDDRINEIDYPPGRDKTTKTETTTMNLPSGKLMALIAVFAAIGIITGTGAFTTVTAERTASVGVAGDAAALLTLDAGNNDYTSYQDGTLQITFDKGVNDEALTIINRIFNVTNQGSQEVRVTIEPGYNASSSAKVIFTNTTFDASGNMKGKGVNLNKTGVVLGPGKGTDVSMKINTQNTNSLDNTSDRIIDNVTIIANATASS